MTAKKQSSRLLALDVMRGITIAGMLLVNNPGSWGALYTPLGHAAWNGLTPTDLVFPFFMFIMGVAMYMSMRKFEFKLTGNVAFKILRRTVVIFAIGLGLSWFGFFCRHIAAGDSFLTSINNLETMRILGVMPRLALCYCAASIAACLVPKKSFVKSLAWVAAGLIVTYSLILILGNGYEIAENNIIYRFDNAVLGSKHMYKGLAVWKALENSAFDPEGLVSTLPAIAHTIVGVLCGHLIVTIKDNDERVKNLFLIGAVLMMIGWLASYGLPINKNIWSPTFVLVTCGMGSTLLALLIWVIDIKGYKKWTMFFETFGINPLFLYVLGGALSILFGCIKLPLGGEMISIHNIIYKSFLLEMLGDKYLASCLYAIIFVCINWCVGYVLYKKKIYIKI
jgi:predicted acyltransferase